MLGKSYEVVISLANYTSKDVLFITACCNNWNMTFLRQDITWIGTKTTLLHDKTFPQFSKQRFVVFFVFFI